MEYIRLGRRDLFGRQREVASLGHTIKMLTPEPTSASEPPASRCVGTRPIKILGKTDGADGALLSAFVDEEKLSLLVSDGLQSFEGSLHPKDTKVPLATDDARSKAEIVAPYLLEKKDGVSVGFENQEGHTIRVVVRERLESGIVKLLWSGSLKKQTEETGCLSTLLKLGESIELERCAFKNVQEEKDRVNQDLVLWKDTAEKLQDSWQGVKDELLQQFLTLFNTAHERLRQAQKEIERLELGRNPVMGDASAVPPRKRRATVIDHPDDYDVLQYGPDVVEKLAKGPARFKKPKTSSSNNNNNNNNNESKPKTTKTTTTNKSKPNDETTTRTETLSSEKTLPENPEDMYGSSQESTTTTTTSPSKRTNPKTGAVELWDAKDLLDDSAVSKMSQALRSATPPPEESNPSKLAPAAAGPLSSQGSKTVADNQATDKKKDTLSTDQTITKKAAPPAKAKISKTLDPESQKKLKEMSDMLDFDF